MLRSTMILAALTIACFTGSALADEPTDVEKEFQEYGELMVGVWTHTDEEGNVKEHEYRWMANKNFIQITIVKDSISGGGIVGIDPETNKLTTWWFVHSPEIGRAHVKEFATKTGDNKWSTEAQGFINNDVPYSSWGSFTLKDNKLIGDARRDKIGDKEETRPGGTWTRIPKGAE